MGKENTEVVKPEDLSKDEQKAVATIGKLAEEFFNNRVEIELLDRKKKEINQVQARLQAKIKSIMENNELQSVGTDFGSLTMKDNEGWKVDDWDKFFGWVFKTEAPEFLQKRFGSPAVREFFAKTGKMPPGVSMHPFTDLAPRINSKYKSERLSVIQPK